jgi:hypothetical protein
MLLGKLATPAIKVIQNGAFSTTNATADYMVVSTQRFVIGEDKTTFELRFGNVITENEQERFDILLRENLKMTSEELSTWGTDDSVLLDLVAAKLGTTITDKVQTDLHHTN